ncbi:MAG: hypothetical protein U0T73_07405 [Chitinophagales bacterium]
MKDLNKELHIFSFEMNDCEEILEVIESANGNKVSDNEKQRLLDLGIPERFIDDFEAFFGFKIKWRSLPDTGVEAGGSVNVMKLPMVFSDWKGQTYFNNTPEDDVTRDFKIVDFYFDEHASGILFGKQKDFTFHNAALNGSAPKSLDLDINGYIEMMMISKGYAHWQLVVEYVLYGGYWEEHTENFKEKMPKLFPDWTWEAWLKKFEEVRLHTAK